MRSQRLFAARAALALAGAALLLHGGAARGRAARAQAALVERVAVVEREVKAGYGGLLKLTAGPRGGVHVSAWREQKVRVEARVELRAPTERDLDVFATAVDVSVESTPTGVAVSTLGPHDKRWMRGVKKFPDALGRMPWRVDYVVWVPESTALEIRVTEGEVLVEGVGGLTSIGSARGPVRLVNTSGATVVNAGDGDVEISTRDRGWRGGNLVAVASRGNIRFAAPAGFSAVFDAKAGGGVTLDAGGEPKRLGVASREAVGAGGPELSLTASGTVHVELR